MFTGIIEEIGEVIAWQPADGAARVTVRAPLAVSDAGHGDSISVAGVCLTVVDQAPDAFTADVMAETIAMSRFATLAPGDRVNLERAARVDSRLGGHIVQGHIDGTAELLSVTDGARWRVLRFALDPELAPLVARKGSITVDGVSLTVSDVTDVSDVDPSAGTALGAGAAGFETPPAAAPQPAVEQWFEVSLIPETLTATTLGALTPGDRVNIETDILARHVARLAQFNERSEP
jgi:riboflavin synthase